MKTNLHDIGAVQAVDAIHSKNPFLATYQAFVISPAVSHVTENVH